MQLLSSYASLAFVCTILQTLTKLAVATLVHVSDQVSHLCSRISEYLILFSFLCQLNLLSEYVRQDPRRTIRLTALNDLLLLAKKTPHLWDSETVKVRFELFMRMKLYYHCLHTYILLQDILLVITIKIGILYHIITLYVCLIVIVCDQVCKINYVNTNYT